MKYIILFALFLISCNHPSGRKDVIHMVHVSMGDNVEEFYILSDIKKTENGCITFTCISNYDWESKVKKTVCGTYIIDY